MILQLPEGHLHVLIGDLSTNHELDQVNAQARASIQPERVRKIHADALNSPLNRKDIKTRAENEYEFVRNQMYDIAKNEFTLRRYHDQALSYGSPPVKYVRALILGEKIPVTSN